jgi:DNA-binding transcriptional LysR family regulator
VLTIGAISSAMLDVLPPLLATLRQRHPELTVSMREIDSAEAIPSLESADIDLASARLEATWGEFVGSMPLKRDKLAVAVPKNHRFAELARIRWRPSSTKTL